MSNWSVCKTTAGRELHNAILSGTKKGPLQITKVVAGRGSRLSTTQLLALASESDVDVVQKEGKILKAQNLQVLDVTESGNERPYTDERAVIAVQLTNDPDRGLDVYADGKETWSLTQIVIFARTTASDECIFLVAQDSEPDLIPLREDNIIVSNYTINLLMKDTAEEYNLEMAELDSKGFITVDVFNPLKARVLAVENDYLSKSKGGIVSKPVYVPTLYEGGVQLDEKYLNILGNRIEGEINFKGYSIFESPGDWYGNCFQLDMNSIATLELGYRFDGNWASRIQFDDSRHIDSSGEKIKIRSGYYGTEVYSSGATGIVSMDYILLCAGVNVDYNTEFEDYDIQKSYIHSVIEENFNYYIKDGKPSNILDSLSEVFDNSTKLNGDKLFYSAGMSLAANGKVRVLSNTSMYLASTQNMYLATGDTLNLDAKKIRVYVGDDLQIIGSTKVQNVKGKNLSDGSKPTITNFSRIHSAVFEEGGVELSNKYAPKEHSHKLGEILGTGGNDVVPVNNGGTGASSFTENQVLVGNGTNAIKTLAVDTSPLTGSNNLITSGGVYTALGNYIPKTNGTAYGTLSVHSDNIELYDDGLVSIQYNKIIGEVGEDYFELCHSSISFGNSGSYSSSLSRNSLDLYCESGENLKIEVKDKKAKISLLGSKTTEITSEYINSPVLKQNGTAISKVATSGSYNDLTNKPTSLPANGGTSDYANKMHIYEVDGSIKSSNGYDNLISAVPVSVTEAEARLTGLTTSNFWYKLSIPNQRLKVPYSDLALRALSLGTQAIPADTGVVRNVEGLDESRMADPMFPTGYITRTNDTLIVPNNSDANGGYYHLIYLPSTSACGCQIAIGEKAFGSDDIGENGYGFKVYVRNGLHRSLVSASSSDDPNYDYFENYDWDGVTSSKEVIKVKWSDWVLVNGSSQMFFDDFVIGKNAVVDKSYTLGGVTYNYSCNDYASYITNGTDLTFLVKRLFSYIDGVSNESNETKTLLKSIMNNSLGGHLNTNSVNRHNAKQISTDAITGQSYVDAVSGATIQYNKSASNVSDVLKYVFDKLGYVDWLLSTEDKKVESHKNSKTLHTPSSSTKFDYLITNSTNDRTWSVNPKTHRRVNVSIEQGKWYIIAKQYFIGNASSNCSSGCANIKVTAFNGEESGTLYHQTFNIDVSMTRYKYLGKLNTNLGSGDNDIPLFDQFSVVSLNQGLIAIRAARSASSITLVVDVDSSTTYGSSSEVPAIIVNEGDTSSTDDEVWTWSHSGSHYWGDYSLETGELVSKSQN